MYSIWQNAVEENWCHSLPLCHSFCSHHENLYMNKIVGHILDKPTTGSYLR